MKRAQKDYQFECFCRDAKYIPQLRKYVVSVNGKAYSSYETDDLFEQYRAALKRERSQ